MAASKKSASQEKELKATVKKLRAKLEKAEATSKWWRKESGRQKEAAARAERQVRKLSKRLEKAALASKPDKPAKPTKAPQPAEAARPAASAEEPPSTPAMEASSSADSEGSASATPDANWTVAQLREEARSRGLTGLSNKPKAELLAALE